MSVHGAKGKFIEYWGRGETGPIAFQKEFDTKIYWPRLKELTKKYNIEYAPGKVVPTDDDELDAIWQAGKELLLDVGILNVSTERRITFTEDELEVLAECQANIRTYVKEQRTKYIIGDASDLEDKDTFVQNLKDTFNLDEFLEICDRAYQRQYAGK